MLLTEAFDLSRVTGLRHSVASCARGAGLTGVRLDDFVVAVNELLTNAVRHGGGAGMLRLLRAGDTVVCEVSDGGAGLDQHAMARQPPPRPDTPGGWGLWLAGRLTDELEVVSGPNGTLVRISSRTGSAPVTVRTDPADAR